MFESTLGIFRVRRQLARHLGLRIHQVRVVSDYMGGGFGAKNGCGVHTIAAALLSRATGRPVKLVLDRREEAGPMSAFRAPYFVEGAFALESAMDLLARRLRHDPLELRLRNLATSDPERDRPYSANALVACYADIARRIAGSDRRDASGRS